MNSSELTLLVLRIGFLLVLWLFIFGIVYALRSDLFGRRARKLPADAAGEAAAPAPVMAPAMTAPPAPAPSSDALTEQLGVPNRAPAPAAGDGRPSRLVILSGPKAGTEFPLGSDPITIGRSSDSSLVIRDDYTSTHHARLMLWNDEWMIQDLDSTNGTFLGGNRVAVPTRVPLNTAVKIGTTSFELRR